MKRASHIGWMLGAMALVLSCSGGRETQVDFQPSPQAVGGTETMLSWNFSGKEPFLQEKYRVSIKGVWDSGETVSPDTRIYLPAEATLHAFRKYRWKVEAWDGEGHRKVGRGKFRTAVWPQGNWTGTWISPSEDRLVKTFLVGKGLRKALLCISSVGGHVATVGGKSAGSPYSVRTSLYKDIAGAYRVYDVTESLDKGPQTVEVLLSGKKPALIAELHLFYRDGSHDIIGTDASWEGAIAPHGSYSLLLPDDSPLPLRERVTPEEQKLSDTLRLFHFGTPVRGNCLAEGRGKKGDVIELRFFESPEKRVGTEFITLDRDGRFLWTDAFMERTILYVTASARRGVRVRVRADIPSEEPPTWIMQRGEVEGFILDPAPVVAPFEQIDSLYTTYGDYRLLEKVYPALENYLAGLKRKESPANYTLMEKYATLLGKDATPYTETIQIMTGK